MKNIPLPPLFKRGDRVRIVDPLPEYMDHFRTGTGTIVGSYYDQYGPPKMKLVDAGTGEDVDMSAHDERDKRIYTVDIDGQGECSWYPEETLEPE